MKTSYRTEFQKPFQNLLKLTLRSGYLQETKRVIIHLVGEGCVG